MSKATIRALLRAYYAAFLNAGDLAALDALASPALRYYAPGIPEGMVGLPLHKDLHTYHRTAFPDLAWTVTHELIDGTMAACRWRLWGTHAGPYAGVAPSGRRIQLTGMDLFVVAEERIAELQRVYDLQALLQQVRGDAVWDGAG
jgi:steroid delta-isomerase-like uncharacterized protein